MASMRYLVINLNQSDQNQKQPVSHLNQLAVVQNQIKAINQVQLMKIVKVKDLYIVAPIMNNHLEMTMAQTDLPMGSMRSLETMKSLVALKMIQCQKQLTPVSQSLRNNQAMQMGSTMSLRLVSQNLVMANQLKMIVAIMTTVLVMTMTKTEGSMALIVNTTMVMNQKLVEFHYLKSMAITMALHLKKQVVIMMCLVDTVVTTRMDH